MLAYFPKPYPDELLYSMLARCKVHMGIDSPKHLLDLLYQKRTVIAVPDLPAQLQLLCNSIQHVQQLNAKQLLYQRTLFPLYAPFIPESRKQHLTDLLVNSDGSAVYVEIGMSAGTVKLPAFFRYCPLCMNELQQEYGEFAWLRRWLVPGYQVCHIHGCELCDSILPLRSIHRHEYLAACPQYCEDFAVNTNHSSKLALLSSSIMELLAITESQSPTYHQWTMFYRELAAEAGMQNGMQVSGTELHSKFRSYWPNSFLVPLNLVPVGPSSWLLAMFRKHRKSFSYLQHLLVWQVHRPQDSVSQLLAYANSFPESASRSQKMVPDGPINQADRDRWLQLLQSGLSVKQARVQYDKALYARLYRHDRTWLLETNKGWHLKRTNHSNTNWHARDRRYLRLLYRVLALRDLELKTPRQSRNWFLKQLTRSSTTEKHLSKLPLCQSFLNRYSETVAEFQIRRLTYQMLVDRQNNQSHLCWELERLCGLANGRTRPLTLKFMELLEREVLFIDAKKIFKRIPPEAKLVALGNQFRRDEPSSFWRFSTFFSRLDRQEYSENFELEALCVMGLGRKFMQNTDQLYTSSGFHQTLTFPPVEQWEEALLGDCPRLAKRLAAKSEVANQRCFVFIAGGVKVWLPKLELARKLFFHAGFMVRAAYLPNGLDNLFQMRLGADKLSYDVFTPSRTGVPIAFLKQPAYREFFSWLLVNKDIRNSFESIWQKLNAEQTIKNGYCRWVFNFNPPTSMVGVEAMFRGIYNHEEKEILVWEIASLSGLPYNTLRTVIFSHPQLKQPVKNGDAAGGGAGGGSPATVEIDTEDEPSGDNERVRIELPSESLSFDREIKTKVNYKGQKGYPGGKGGGESLSDAGAIQTVSTKDDVIDGRGRAGDFDQLGLGCEGDTNRYAERFTALIDVIKELSKDQRLEYLGTKIEPLPVVKRCSYHKMNDEQPRCYLLAKFKRTDGEVLYILDIDTSDGARAISTLILHSCPDFTELLEKTLVLTLRKSLRWHIANPLRTFAIKHPVFGREGILSGQKIESWVYRLTSSLLQK